MAAQPITIEVGAITLHGLLRIAGGPRSLVLFAHGSGSGRLSPRNTFVAERLGEVGIGTLLFDLLTEKEERLDAVTAELRFDIPLLTDRLVVATHWTLEQPHLGNLPLGYFGASTGAAAALAAAARVPEVAAVVSRGGRPDLAGAALPRVKAPTLLIVGGNDPQVLALNQQALERMHCQAEITVVPGATHLFEEAGALEQVAALAARWFTTHLQAPSSEPRSRQE
jgi:putative phosphoribosyl transferase